jgi:single-strand DNA-binding protein
MTENQFILAGYLGAKPELRYLPAGTPVANVRLAQSYTLKGNCEERTNWFNLVFYGNIATVAMKFEKGDNIHVTAFLEHREWETKAGSKRHTYEVVVKTCHRIAGVKEASPEKDHAGSNPSKTRSLENNAGVEIDVNENDGGWVV